MSEYKLYCGDCLEVMHTMGAGSVDFVFTDVPYNVGKDYGTYKDNMSDDEYLGWMGQVIAEIKRVARAACIYVPQKYIRDFWWMLGRDYRQIILSYSPEGAFRWGFVNQFSSLLTNASPVQKTKNVWHNCQMPGLGYFFRENTFGHPGYTSEDITARVIQSFTRPGETILDPFVGTGTTSVIAMRFERSSIGVDIHPAYIAIAEKRIKQAALQGILPLDL